MRWIDSTVAAECRGRDWTREVVSLGLVAAPFRQEPEVFGRLHAFGNHLDAEVVRHRHDRPYHGRSIWLGHCLHHETLVDLQPVDRILQEIGEAAEPCAEVVDGDARAALANQLQLLKVRGRVDHQRVFGQFELQVLGGKAADFQRLVDHLQQILLFELTRRQVDRYREVHAQDRRKWPWPGCTTASTPTRRWQRSGRYLPPAE